MNKPAREPSPSEVWTLENVDATVEFDPATGGFIIEFRDEDGELQLRVSGVDQMLNFRPEDVS